MEKNVKWNDEQNDMNWNETYQFNIKVEEI